MSDLALYAACALAISTGLAGIICAGFPTRCNHSRVWRQAQLEREVRDQLANAEALPPALLNQIHAVGVDRG